MCIVLGEISGKLRCYTWHNQSSNISFLPCGNFRPFAWSPARPSVQKNQIHNLDKSCAKCINVVLSSKEIITFANVIVRARCAKKVVQCNLQVRPSGRAARNFAHNTQGKCGRQSALREKHCTIHFASVTVRVRCAKICAQCTMQV